MITKAQRTKKRNEFVTRLTTRASGVISTAIGFSNERFYIIAGKTEPVHGTVIGFNITTSFLLIGLGIIIFALSFPKIYSLLGRLINRKKD